MLLFSFVFESSIYYASFVISVEISEKRIVKTFYFTLKHDSTLLLIAA